MNSPQEAEVPRQSEPVAQSHPDPHGNEVAVVAHFGWVEIKTTEGIEINYLDTFLKNCNGSTVDYRKLEIPKSDPGPLNDKDLSFDIASIHTRLSKWGGLSMGSKKEKNKELNYDLEDSFIDDNEGNISGIQNPGFIEPVVEDFICVRGGVQAFKASNYYLERVKTIKQSLTEVTKKKKVEPKEAKEPKDLKEHKEPKPKQPKVPKEKKPKENSAEKPKKTKENSGEKSKKAKENSAEKSKKTKENSEEKPKEDKEPKELKEQKETKEPKEGKEPKEPKKKNPGANKRKRSSGSGIERPPTEEKRVKQTKDSPAATDDSNYDKIIHVQLS